MPRSPKSLHPTFRRKHVVQLECKFCGTVVCTRGMKAILLADTTVELYSTDFPPTSAVDLVDAAYCTEKCRCRIKDFACLGCGNVIGYAVVQPCRTCLESCNNGHLWMYHSQAIDASLRTDHTGEELLLWAQLVDSDENGIMEKLPEEEECCR